MLVQSPVHGDARVVREALALTEAGHEVIVVGRGVPRGADLPDGVTVLDAGRPAGLGSAGTGGRRGALAAGRRVGRWLLLPEHRAHVEATWRAAVERLVQEVPADVIHAHDLNTLALAVTEARRRGARLVYDAHELWSDRGLPGRPTPVRDRRAGVLEARWAAEADVVLTVSDGIAAVLRSRGLTQVIVVRNTFPDIGPPPAVPSEPTGILYAGRVGPGRDLETLLAAGQRRGSLPVSLIGPEDPAFASRLRLPDGVRHLPPLHVDALDPVLAQHGIAAITLTGRVANHRLALPNKLFHAVRAGVPVVAADLPEIRRIVTRHDLGELYAPGDAESLSRAVASVRGRWPRLVRTVRDAAPALRWDTDRQVLLGAYERLTR